MSIPSEKTIQLTVKCVVRSCVVVAVLLTDFLLLVFAFMQKKKKKWCSSVEIILLNKQVSITNVCLQQSLFSSII